MPSGIRLSRGYCPFGNTPLFTRVPKPMPSGIRLGCRGYCRSDNTPLLAVLCHGIRTAFFLEIAPEDTLYVLIARH